MADFFICFGLFLYVIFPEEFISWLWLDNIKILGTLIRTQDMTAGSHLEEENENKKKKDNYSVPQCVLLFLILWKILLPCTAVLFWNERAGSGSLCFQTVEYFKLSGSHLQTPVMAWCSLTELSLWNGQCSHAATPPCTHLMSQLLEAIGALGTRESRSLRGWVKSQWPGT